MTFTSIEQFSNFLVNHQKDFFDEMRIADYGGIDEGDGTNIIRELLESGNLKNYQMLDFESGVDLRKPIKGKKFDMGICMDLLEHTSNPFTVAKNIMNSLKPGAYLFVTVPFVWWLHGFPDDYWRFTPHGLSELFKEMETESVFAIVDRFNPKAEISVDPDYHPIIPVTEPFSRIIGIFRKKIK